MYTICPNCGETVEDHGSEQVINCEHCGQNIYSREFGKRRMKESNKEYNILFEPPADYRRFQQLPTYSKSRALGNSGVKVSPIRAILGFFCTLGVLSFIFILLFNFLAFFPAIAITSPNLLKEHEIQLDSEIPIIIDNTAPIINYNSNTTISTTSGEIVEIAVIIFEEHLRDSYLKFQDNNKKISWFRYDQNKDLYLTTFQAPEEPGSYDITIYADDYCGNVAEFPMFMEVKKSTFKLFISSPEYFNYINSSSDISFQIWQDQISNVSYNLNYKAKNISLEQNQLISTRDWQEGLNTLNFTIKSISGRQYYQNLTIYLDDSKPELEFLSVKSLTLGRQETFRDRVNKTTYYRGEFVKVIAKIHDKNLRSAQVILKNKIYNLVRVPLNTISNHNDNGNNKDNEEVYQSIISLPTKPSKYKLKLIAEDLAGNKVIKSHDIQVVKINFDNVPVPVLTLNSGTETQLNLPIANSSATIELQAKMGAISGVEYISLNSETPSPNYTYEISEDEAIITNLSDGAGLIYVKSEIRYHIRDYLFITYPFPPYFYVIPVAIVGWYLLCFFIFIATAIILSNLYLIKSSFSSAVSEIKSSFSKLHGPMINSKNSIIMIAQIFLAVFSFSVIYNYILSLNKVTTHTPDFSSLSLWTLIYNLTTAAVYEEIISRVLLIGIPLLIIHALLRKTKKPKWRYILGGGFKINKLAIFLILFSSVTFGLAHAPGWDYWKVLPSFVSGLALSYLFVTKGVYLSILLHFSINFLTIPLAMADYPLGPRILYGFMIFFWIIVGFIYIVYYLKNIIKVLFLRKNKAGPKHKHEIDVG